MNQDIDNKRETYISDHSEYNNILEGHAETLAEGLQQQLPKKRPHINLLEEGDEEMSKGDDDTNGSSEKRPKK